MKIGDTINFVPCCGKDDPQTHDPRRKHEQKVRGRIVGVNRAHHWYRVEYEINGFVGHECFKYIPAGKALTRRRRGSRKITRAGHHNKKSNA